MKLLLRHRPSPAMIVALLALIVAASGTAIAAGRLVIGDNLIKPRSLSADRLRNHAITGVQVNLSKLGEVPKAKNAEHAFVAGSSEDAVNAQDAASATNAKHATNADTVGGQAPSAFAPASSFVRTGLVTATAGQTVELAAFGPFTLTLNCTSGTQAMIDATSTESNSKALQFAMAVAGTPSHIDSASSGGFQDTSGVFLAPSGRTYTGVMTVGRNVPGISAPCVANALISQS
jgi:hypothetical protein